MMQRPKLQVQQKFCQRSFLKEATVGILLLVSGYKIGEDVCLSHLLFCKMSVE